MEIESNRMNLIIESESNWQDLCLFAPALTKGLRPGQSRKVILTQTAKGIKLERAKND